MIRAGGLGRLALVAGLVASTGGCATLLGGGRTALVVEVDGPPATTTIRVNGLETDEREVYYATRAEARLARTSAYVVIAEAPGYLAAERLIARRLNGWLLADALLGAPLVALGWPLNVRLLPGGPDILSATGGAVALGAIAIDLATGNAWSHAERRVALKLAPAPPKP